MSRQAKRKFQSCEGSGSHSRFKRNRVVHDRQMHHRANIPPWLLDTTTLACKFPNPGGAEWEKHAYRDDRNDDDDKYTVPGEMGFTHVRCPLAAIGALPPCPGCGRHTSHPDSIIVAVDGACPHNGSARATRSSYGVYFGSDGEAEEWNISARVKNHPDYPVHTSQRAELHGAIAALKAVKEFIKNGGQWPCDLDECTGGDFAGKNGCKVRHVVIKSDSAYVVNSVTEYIGKWMANGWLNAARKPVANRDLWEKLIIKLRQIRRMGAGVDFWLVPRERNEEADELANDALQEDSSESSCEEEGTFDNVVRFINLPFYLSYLASA